MSAADVVISATAGEEPLLSGEAVAAAMASRPERPLVLIDAAVPRDIDPRAGELAGVRLCDIDDLRRLAEAAMTTRRSELPRVHAILDEELEHHRADARGRAVAPLVTALRQRGEAVREEELQRLSGRLAALGEEERELVERPHPAHRRQAPPRADRPAEGGGRLGARGAPL